MELDKINKNILKRKTLDELYCILKKKKNILDSSYKSTRMYLSNFVSPYDSLAHSLIPELYQPSGTTNTSFISLEPVQPTNYTNIDSDDW
jgi:hypothetical protein